MVNTILQRTLVLPLDITPEQYEINAVTATMLTIMLH